MHCQPWLRSAGRLHFSELLANNLEPVGAAALKQGELTGGSLIFFLSLPQEDKLRIL